MKRDLFFLMIVFCIIAAVAGFSYLISQEEKILREYFVINPQERIKEYEATLSSSIARHFIMENKESDIDGTLEYIRKYGRTDLFDIIFIFKDKVGGIKQMSRTGLTTVTKDILHNGEYIYPVSIDNGRIEGYLAIIMRETSKLELKEGLKKYNAVSYSLRFMFLLLLAALSVIALYHNYSARMKLARIIAEMKASNDSLTGLYTREHFLKALAIEIEKFRIYHTPVGLLMLDIDHFKEFNDTLGHLAGDRLLVDITKIMKLSTRASDVLARYGGEEFAIIIPYIDKPGRIRDKERLKNFVYTVRNVAERIRKNVEDYRASFLPEPAQITISIGASFFYKRSNNIASEILLEKADKALYKAKRLGRNRICIDYESTLL